MESRLESLAVSPEPAARGRRPFLILGAVVAVGMGALGVWYVLTLGTESTDDAQVEADVVPLSSRVTGTVLRVHVSDDQPVKAGDVLVEIDPADHAAKAHEAEADLAAARAQAAAADAQVRIVRATANGGLGAAQAHFAGAGAGVRSAEAQVAAARAALARAEAEWTRTSIDRDRMRALRTDGSVPQQRLDDAQAANDMAAAAVAQARAFQDAGLEQRRAAQEAVAEAKGRVDQSAPADDLVAAAQAAADLARARVQAAEAALEEARLQLRYTTIAAPVDGTVSRLEVHPGQTVQPHQRVVELVPNETYVVANFKETQVGRMRSGQPAEIRVDTLPGQAFRGVVETLSPGTGARFSLIPPDNATGNFVKVVQRVPVKIRWVEAPPAETRHAGLSVEVSVQVD